MSFRRIASLKTPDALRQYLHSLGLELPMDDAPLSAEAGSPLAQPLRVGGFTAGNRWAIQPMEGWDAAPDGQPTEHTFRRWKHFGESGAKIIWGCEAFAVQHDGRANPNQLYHSPQNTEGLRGLYRSLIGAHRERFGPDATDDLLVGLQLTHSGRFSKPNHNDLPEPRIACRHPLLDRRLGISDGDDSMVLSDGEVREIIVSYVAAAKTARNIGFQFVDVKHCHGYLGHEFLSAHHRPGPYGGSFENRTRFMHEIIQGIRDECPGLLIGVRLSLFDTPPFQPDPNETGSEKAGRGVPDVEASRGYPGFGCNRENPMEMDLAEPVRLLRLMRDEWGVAMVNLSAGSPYYNPHIQRPAFFPPSDGYQPPEDPLVGCARQMRAVREIRQAVPGLPIVGSAYSYFQEYLPHIAQAAVRAGWVDAVGLGRVALSYWELPADTLEGRPFQNKRLCRTFSDCTTAPRNGLISGCYPLDDHYKNLPEAMALKSAKLQLRERLKVIPCVE